MAPKQRMRIANEIASKNITQRGNVPKTTKVLFRIYTIVQINKETDGTLVETCSITKISSDTGHQVYCWLFPN